MKRTATVACLRDEGVRVEEWELPELQPGQVLVEPILAPINPADWNVVTGTYGVRPTLPVVLGNEGVGVVTVGSLPVGQRLIAPIRMGWWCTARVLNAADVIPIPDDIPVEVAAMLAVNPPTAYRMLRDFVQLKPGDWLIQNAANSGVGRCVIEIARANGWHTINVVRRKELIPELTALGADMVITADAPVAKQVAGKEIKLGLNAVGGDSARQLAQSLAPHGTLVTYGAMGRDPVRVDNGLLIFRDIRVRGFWVSEWYRHAPRADIVTMFAELESLVRAGKFRVPVEQTYPLDQIHAALTHANRNQRTGKILVAMRSEVS